MSYQEKLQRAQVIVEFQDAEDNLTALRDEAIRLSNELQEVACKIMDNAMKEPSQLDFTVEGDLKNRLTPDEIAKLGSATSVISLISQLRRARQTLYNLRRGH